MDANFRRGLQEAAELFDAFTAERNKREAANALKANTAGWQKQSKPPLYTKILANKAVGECPVTRLDPLDVQNCECDPNSEEVSIFISIYNRKQFNWLRSSINSTYFFLTFQT